jgi:hypothetical protein
VLTLACQSLSKGLRGPFWIIPEDTESLELTCQVALMIDIGMKTSVQPKVSEQLYLLFDDALVTTS